MSPPAEFTHVLKRTDNRLMIESTCARCGAIRLVSHHDGTLAEWEAEHTCRGGQSGSQPHGDPQQDGTP